MSRAETTIDDERPVPVVTVSGLTEREAVRAIAAIVVVAIDVRPEDANVWNAFGRSPSASDRGR
jgi:chemotaxis response regulator CheB